MSTARYEEYNIDQGTDFSLEIDLERANGTPLNLTNYNIVAKCKEEYVTSDSNSITFYSSVPEPLEGKFIISLSNEQTSNMNANKYVYDVIVSYSDGDAIIKEKVLGGILFIDRSVL